MDEHQKIDWEIISKSFRGTLTEAEQQQLVRWLQASPEHLRFYEKAKRGKETDVAVELNEQIIQEKRRLLLSKIRQRSLSERISYWARYAAVLLLLIGSALALWQRKEKQPTPPVVVQQILPGRAKAILEAENGKTYLLDTNSLVVAGLPGHCVKSEKKQLIYDIKRSDETVYHKLTVPRGGEYELVLSDGTHVRMNSASELCYPAAFDEKQRVVYLHGEAYFEVSRDTACPFLVMVDQMQIKVYGTEFNVNANIPGKVQTVLVKGSVGITTGERQEVMLRPNQLAEYSVEEQQITVQEVNPYYYVAWKEGEFVFEDETVEAIMERLSLWYDVEVFYQNEEVKKQCFTGVITRFSSISDVLHLIGSTATVEFEIKERTIVVK